MGESVCLVHSFSCAATISHEPKECLLQENPLHALSQSISFGRFMTESLEWGKWSTFSHKKYVEEAEKYSRPGSVAQKKAFFEAHYKKIAVAKKAAAAELLEQQERNLKPSENAHELEPAQKQEVKEQNTETGIVVEAVGSDLNIGKGDDSEKIKVEMDNSVGEKEVLAVNSMRVDPLDKPEFMDGNEASNVMVPNGMEQKESYTKGDSFKIGKNDEDKNRLAETESVGKKAEDREMFKKIGSVCKNGEEMEMFKKIGSVGKNDEGRESLQQNVSDSSRISEKCSTPVRNPNVAANHSLSEKKSERKEQVKTKKPALQKWLFLPTNCLFAPFGSKIQVQEARTEKDKPKKKQQKLRCSLCFKPKLHEESGTAKTQIKNFQSDLSGRKV